MPLQVIMTAAKTVSRARDAVSGPPDTMSVTMSATSMIVTATASTSEPNGSPTRWATTSAWWTAASTAAARTTATRATTGAGGFRPQVRASTTRATTGPTVTQRTRGRRAAAVMGTRWHEGGTFGAWCGASRDSWFRDRRSLQKVATTVEACDGGPGVRAELYEHSLEDAP